MVYSYFKKNIVECNPLLIELYFRPYLFDTDVLHDASLPVDRAKRVAAALSLRRKSAKERVASFLIQLSARALRLVRPANPIV